MAMQFAEVQCIADSHFVKLKGRFTGDVVSYEIGGFPSGKGRDSRAMQRGQCIPHYARVDLGSQYTDKDIGKGDRFDVEIGVVHRGACQYKRLQRCHVCW